MAGPTPLLEVLRLRKGVLVASFIVAAGVSGVLALGGGETFSSSTQVLIPPVPLLPKSSPALAMELEDFVETKLGSRVREALGSESSALVSVGGSQSGDAQFYRVSIVGTTPEVAGQAAAIAADLVIQHADYAASAMTARVNDEVHRAATPVAAAIDRSRRGLDAHEASVGALVRTKGDLTQRLDALHSELSIARAAEDDLLLKELKSEADRLDAQVTQRNRQLGRTRGLLDDQIERLSFLKRRRDSLYSVLLDAQRAQLARKAGASIVTNPTPPEKKGADPAQLLLPSVALGLLAASLVLAALERSRISLLVHKTRLQVEPVHGS